MSFLSKLKPELPPEECGRVQRMQSCHLISAYCHYLFKTSSDTLAGAVFLRWKGKQRKKKKIEKYQRDCRRYIFSDLPIVANSLEGGDIYNPSPASHSVHLRKSSNLSVLLLCDLPWFVSSNWFTNSEATEQTKTYSSTQLLLNKQCSTS